MRTMARGVVLSAVLVLAASCGPKGTSGTSCDCGQSDYTAPVCAAAGEKAKCATMQHALQPNGQSGYCSAVPRDSQVNCCVFTFCDGLPELPKASTP